MEFFHQVYTVLEFLLDGYLLSICESIEQKDARDMNDDTQENGLPLLGVVFLKSDFLLVRKQVEGNLHNTQYSNF